MIRFSCLISLFFIGSDEGEGLFAGVHPVEMRAAGRHESHEFLGFALAAFFDQALMDVEDFRAAFVDDPSDFGD